MQTENLIDRNNNFRPSICGNQNDRICANGPSLQFVFDIDGAYQSSTEKILNYFTTNFKVVHNYLKRLKYVHIIYRENENIDQRNIVNETCKYLVTRVYLYEIHYSSYIKIYQWFLGIKNFQKMLEKYKQQITDVDKIKTTHMLGMFHLKLHPLKNVAKPTCEYLLDLVEKTLVKYVQGHTKTVSRKFILL